MATTTYGGWFIQEHNGRIADQCNGSAELAFIAARVRASLPMLDLNQAKTLQQIVNNHWKLIALYATKPTKHQQVLSARHDSYINR